MAYWTPFHVCLSRNCRNHDKQTWKGVQYAIGKSELLQNLAGKSETTTGVVCQSRNREQHQSELHCQASPSHGSTGSGALYVPSASPWQAKPAAFMECCGLSL